MRRFELAVNLLIFLGPLAVATLVLVVSGPLAVLMSLACFGIGLALVLRVKMSLFRRGIWVSFGPSHLTETNRTRYFAAYGFLAVGALLNLLAQVLLYGTVAG